MGNVFKSAVKEETFLLDHSDQRNLVSSQWPLGFKTWLLYRSITMLYLLGLLIVAFVDKFMRYQWKFFTFLTHWGFLMFVLNHLIKWICLIKYKKWFTQHNLTDISKEETPLLAHQQPWLTNPKDKNHSLLSISWVVANIANPLAILITINYWPGGAGLTFENLQGILNFQLHGVNVAMAMLDMILVAQPTLLLHFYQPILFFYSYVSFTAFYYVAGGKSKEGTTAIYNFLDWAKPNQTLINMSMMGLQVLLIHTTLWLFAILRNNIAAWIQKKNLV
uniref:Uncharacterized protein n=1 Tax=Strigamia maritima TaxID=126957 RepID=T1J464_STRMM